MVLGTSLRVHEYDIAPVIERGTTTGCLHFDENGIAKSCSIETDKNLRLRTTHR